MIVIEAGGDLDANVDVLLFGNRMHDGADFFDPGSDIESFRAQLELSGLHLHEIEHVVDEMKQVLAALEDVFEILLLFFIDRTRFAIGEKLRETDNAVERRTQLVGHAGQKAVFGLIGPFQLVVLLLQRALDPFAVGMSRMALVTSKPSGVRNGLRLISTGNSVPSRRKP